MGKTIRGKDKKTKHRIIASIQPKTKYKINYANCFQEAVDDASNRGKAKFYNVNE